MPNAAKVWESLRTSYWFVPSLMSAAAVGAAFGVLELDNRVADQLPGSAWWLYGGEAPGARAVLAAIVGSMISVTSVVFSITVVALTLASGQFGPRLLRNFMRDRATQTVMGVFIATFIYALLVMRAVQGGEQGSFVPPLAVTLAVVLVIASMGFLIFFIHHIALSIQAGNVIATIAGETVEAIDRLFPEGVGEHGARPMGEEALPDTPADMLTVSARADGYIQIVDTERMLKIAARHDVVVWLQSRPGDWVVRGASLGCISATSHRGRGCVDEIAKTFVQGRNRTFTQDAEFGVLQLVEVGVRALSPGVNDPFTAITCVDWLSAILRRLADRDFPERNRFDEDGRLRLVLSTSSFGGFVDSGFHEIRRHAAGSVAVLSRLLEAIANVLGGTARADRRAVLLRHADLIMLAAMSADLPPSDMQDLHERRAAVQRAASEDEGAQPV
ncbi:MAG: DUF2254 domain-containing protein [Gemmatimonadota bacterium]